MFTSRVSLKTVVIFIILNLIPLGFLILATMAIVELWRKKKLKLRVLSILKENPNGVTAPEIGDCVRISLETVHSALEVLVKDGLVKSEMKRHGSGGLHTSYTIAPLGVKYIKKG